MKVVNKTKKYTCLKIEHTENFFIELGQILGERLEIIKEKNPLRHSDTIYYIEINGKSVDVLEIRGDFLLIDLETKRVQIIDFETLKNDYYVLEEI